MRLSILSEICVALASTRMSPLQYTFQFYLRYAPVLFARVSVGVDCLSILSEICTGAKLTDTLTVFGRDFQFYLRYAYPLAPRRIDGVNNTLSILSEICVPYTSRFFCVGIQQLSILSEICTDNLRLPRLRRWILSILSEICKTAVELPSPEAVDKLSILSEICCVALVMVVL